MNILIRSIEPGDAAVVAQLCSQLGYDLTELQVADNIKSVLNTPNNAAFVAVDNGKVIGWIGVSQTVQIESLTCCEIRGLVVDNARRNAGVGKMLVEKAKSWTAQRGNDRLRLRCNMKRTETHLFYEHLNFKETKQQKVFEIRI